MKKFAALSSVLGGTGLFSGNLVFDKSLRKHTIGQVLEEQNISILDMYGDEESWLVLAQQYRENGTTQRVSRRALSYQQNPGFIDIENWKRIAKNLGGFEKDEELAHTLKQLCYESLEEEYSDFLYSNVLNWCRIEIPDYVKDILKIQKESGDCRFWLIKSVRNLTGWFIWEAIDQGIDRDEKGALSALRDILKSDKGKPIRESCSKNRYKHVELSWHPETAETNSQYSWKLSPDWVSGSSHRLALQYVPLTK